MHSHHLSEIAASGRKQWEQVLSQVFVPGRVSSCTNVQGRVERHLQVNHFTIAQLSVEPQTIHHTMEHLAPLPREVRNSILVHIVLGGSGFIEQDEKRIPFRGGDISFRNLNSPSSVSFDTQTEFFALRMPDMWLPPSFHGLLGRHELGPKVVDGANGIAQIARCVLGYLESHMSIGSVYASFALPWLLAAAYHGTERIPHNAATNLSRWQQVLDYIERNLFDAEALTPSACAAAIGISERYLYRLFAARELRFTRLVRERRLDMAHALLSDPSCRQASITSIAYQSGFANPAHFSRAFKQRFGMSPRQCRDQR